MTDGKVCSKCNGRMRYVDSNGTIQTCWDCLNSGEMDQHAKNPKDSGIVI